MKGWVPVRDFMVRQTHESDLRLIHELAKAPLPASVDELTPVHLGSVRKVLWERRCGDPTCPAMECEALLYPISNGVKEAANSGFAAALRQIAGQARSRRSCAAWCELSMDNPQVLSDEERLLWQQWLCLRETDTRTCVFFFHSPWSRTVAGYYYNRYPHPLAQWHDYLGLVQSVLS
ncbi:hypothetical protein PisoF_03933 [Pseudomonas sp. IsoF]|uniref:hypothetical protein n=1 Tax=Pseudomonas sp. IsoF TaxID=2821559 RepID=UPI00206B40F0|nr:hypothetical protein [Pseudomonas sp. IsoF]UPL08227.1 hypothetical protein PisoF_03933 [Pseudomonas sp. IsoF]